jgi:hypothetical protein
MVSCDTWKASVPGCVRFSQPAICSGDQFRSSFAATACRNWPCTANLHGFGRSACFHVRLSAAAARYHRDPPLRTISRLTVDGERPNARAIERTGRPATRPREISSRSASVSANRDRRRDGGLIPPLTERWLKMQDDGLPSTRPIAFRPSPLFQRSQSSWLCPAVNPIR